jgi:hypothetical protein
MDSGRAHELYSPLEIAKAAGVPEAEVLVVLGHARGLVPHAEALRIGRMLSPHAGVGPRWPAARPMFEMFSGAAFARRPAGVPLALSSTLHASLVALAVFLAAFNLSPRAAALRPDDRPADPMRLVFLSTPGPGGGGGGGGLLQKAPPPQALREGRSRISSPIPERREPKPLRPIPVPP